MNKLQRLYKIKQMGCIVCELFLNIEDSPSDIHHITDGGRRLGDDFTIPLCPEHHRIGKYGVARSSGKKAFEKAYLPEMQLLKIVNEKIAYKK